MGIEEIKRKKIEEYISDFAGKEQEQQEKLMQLQQLQENVAILESTAKKIMSKEAVLRYGNLKLAHPETALKAIVIVAQAAQSGYKEIDDKKFKEILIEIQKQEKQNI